MANNFGGGSFTLMDYSREKASVGFNTAAITAASIAGALTQFGALRTAIEGITAGVVAAEALYVNRSKLSNVPPVSPEAQREKKWLVTYEDSTEFFDAPVNAIPNAGYKGVFNIEIPTADLTNVPMIANTDDANMGSPAMSAFITAFQNLARSPYGGEVTVTRVQFVGRNS